MMDEEGKISEEEHLAICHHHKVLNTALDLLRKFKGNHLFKNRQVTYGSMASKRQGKRRQIQFLQVGETQGDLELRIEVFVVKRGEGE